MTTKCQNRLKYLENQFSFW